MILDEFLYISALKHAVDFDGLQSFCYFINQLGVRQILYVSKRNIGLRPLTDYEGDKLQLGGLDLESRLTRCWFLGFQ